MTAEVKEIFEANSKNVRELLCENGLGLYIPPYQRPYGWDKEKVSKLVHDTLHGYTELGRSDESFTFLGTVITIHDINFVTFQPGSRQDVPGKLLNIIDGQQRLTTLLAFCMALHNQIRILHSKYFRKKDEGSIEEWESWLNDITQKVLNDLFSTFVDRQQTGDSPLYPRMIRSFDDQWSKKRLHAKYESPIANLINKYVINTFEEKLREFKAVKRDGSIEGEEALCERFNQISKILKDLGTDEAEDDLEDIPSLRSIAHDSKFQRALLNHDFPDEVRDQLIKKPETPDFAKLLQLVLIANFLLSRVALTVVRGKNEDYAFTIFESLNTTGEPLTAFETFKPQVVMAERLDQYESSLSREHINHITDYLSTFKVGEPLQKATRELIITFASNESGHILSKRLADQRRYLKDEFEQHKNDADKREKFIKNLRDVADFTKYSWVAQDENIHLYGLPTEASTNAVKLCLAFLKTLNHSITIGPIVRFYSGALSASDSERGQKIKDFEEAIKAVTAFSALWRASRRGTKNIDRQYRDILIGANEKTTKSLPLARSVRRDGVEVETSVDIKALKGEFRARLAHKDFGDLKSRDDFVNQAVLIPVYTNNRALSRFLLLAAYHDSVADSENNGLIVKGRSAVSPCLTFEEFKDDRSLTLEHIAPQDSGAGWDTSLYIDKELVHRIGNLVLVPRVANSSFATRPWQQKRILYKVLGAVSTDVAARILDEARRLEGIEFGESTEALMSSVKHLPQLAALGDRKGQWDAEFIDQRSRRILELAYDELYKWLE